MCLRKNILFYRILDIKSKIQHGEWATREYALWEVKKVHPRQKTFSNLIFPKVIHLAEKMIKCETLQKKQIVEINFLFD